MQESSAPALPIARLPFWRIALACYMFGVSALDIWLDFSEFRWVAFFCLGINYLIFVPRQKGEPARIYFSKPRNVISFVLLGVIIAGSLNTLYRIFARRIL